MGDIATLSAWLEIRRGRFGPPVSFAAGARFARLDLSSNNERLGELRGADPAQLGGFIAAEIARQGAVYGVGGYGEDRAVYRMSALFGDGEGARTVHLGVDVWMPAGTEVLSPVEGVVHSYADNTAPGDYGPTIILRHDIEGRVFHTLYGHLSRCSLSALGVGDEVDKGRVIATLGDPGENGGWPAHLHFQIIEELGGRRGDYPGVATRDDWPKLSSNCPNPEPMLGALDTRN